MLRYLQFRREIWRLERRARAEREGTERAIERAKARNAPPHEIDEITGGSSEGVLLYRIREAMSDYLISEASRLFIPLPDWEKRTIDGDSGNYVLTPSAINELRSAIRAERKARAELFVLWMPGIIGILGALIGLAAILVGKGK